jgi:hypothetical protein
MQLNVNFESDGIGLLRQRLQAAGYSEAGLADGDVPIAYFNAARRRVPICPRMIKRSQEFACPIRHQAGLTKLETAVRDGDDLKPWLSRRLKSMAANDPLLNDWAIYHLHLGTTQENDGFIARTGDVLFARIIRDAFYEIQIYPHQQWSNLGVVEIIHENWPDTIKTFEVTGVIELSHTPDVKRSRAGNINTSVQMKDGTIYMPLGGGFMTDGTGLQIRLAVNNWTKQIRAFEKAVREKSAEIAKKLKEHGCSNSECDVRLVMDETGAFGYVPPFPIKFQLSKQSNLLPL